MERFCAVCGKKTEKIISGLCVRHFLEKNPVIAVPAEIPIETEKNTGKIRRKGRWVNPLPENTAEIIKSKIKTAHIHNPKISVKPEASQNVFSVIVQGEVNGTMIEDKKLVTVKPVLVQSDAEMRLKSNYHEAIVQVRFREKPSHHKKSAALEEALAMLAAEKARDALAGASGINSRREGIDIMVGSRRGAKAVAKNLARKHGGVVRVSFKLVGKEKSGKDKKRFTYSVRI